MFWLFSSNPLTAREARERWRRPFSLLYLFLYASGVALLGLYFYRSLVPDSVNATGVLGLGAPLFQRFGGAQLSIWAGLGILLAAPTLAAERERRSLVDFFLAGLSPAQIVAAKWRSLAGFALVTMLAPLPTMTICFWLGGVGFWEFAAFTFALLGVGAASCACGLTLSVDARSVSRAISSASLVGTICALVGDVFLFPLLLFPPVIVALIGVLGVSAASYFLTETTLKLQQIGADLEREQTPPREYEAKIVFESGVAVRMRASEGDFQSPDPNFALPTLAQGTTLVLPPIPQDVEVGVKGRLAFDNSVWEDDLEKWARFSPVAWRMWRDYLAQTTRFSDEKFQPHPRRAALMVGFLQMALALFYPSAPFWEVGVGAAAILGAALLIAQLAPAFVREKQAQTLQSLALSALREEEILAGKIGGAFLITARWGFWPLVSLSLWGLVAAPLALLPSLIFLLSFWVWTACVACLASLRARHASVAVNFCWTALGLVILIAPLLPPLRWWGETLRALVVSDLVSPSQWGQSALFFAVLSGGFWGVSIWLLRRAVREK